VLDIKAYKPGRFAYLMNLPFARELWGFLADDSRVQKMLFASNKGKPAIEPLLSEIENRFEEPLASKDYPGEEIAVFINNMIRQVLEMSGYELLACAKIPAGRYIKSSGLFCKRSSS
jgi:hypothetical protein